MRVVTAGFAESRAGERPGVNLELRTILGDAAPIAVIYDSDVAATLEALTEAWTEPAGRFDEWCAQARSGASISRTTA